LAALTEGEYRDLTLEARGADDTDVRAIILRELNKPLPLNSDALARQALDR